MNTFSDIFPLDTSRVSLLAAQRLVAERAVSNDDFKGPELVAGVDQAFFEKNIISGIIVMDYTSRVVVEKAYSFQPVDYPYVPTFLSFREGPSIVNTFKKLNTSPDILLVDGAGLNHPRRAGLATHVGVFLDVPTIGIIKRILCGSGKEPESEGEANPLFYENKRIGWLLKSNKRSRPIVIAPGHRVSLDTSLSIVKACLGGYKLPEPVRLAHNYVNRLKKDRSMLI